MSHHVRSSGSDGRSLNGHSVACEWTRVASTRISITAAAAGQTYPAVKEAVTGRLDIVQEWGEQSFPASDPPANW